MDLAHCKNMFCFVHSGTLQEYVLLCAFLHICFVHSGTLQELQGSSLF